MNNSESPLYQQRSNLELSAAECVFLEIKKSSGFPSCLLCSLPLLHAFLHRHSFGIWQHIDFFASELPHLRLKQVLCNSVRSDPAVSLQDCSGTVTEAPLKSRKPHLLSTCPCSWVHVYLCEHSASLLTHIGVYGKGMYSPFPAVSASLQHLHCQTRRFTGTSNFN